MANSPVVLPTFPPSPNGRVDVNRNLDWFVGISKTVIPWLADNVAINNIDNSVTNDATIGPRVFPVDPGNIYAGPKPYLVWLSPMNGIARSNGMLMNIPNKPNIYIGSYRETPYNNSSGTTLEQRRMYDAYSLLASFLRPYNELNAPCPPTGLSIKDVRLEHAIPTVYIETPSELYVGALFIVEVTEEYAGE